jgi:hypothetical protein
MGGIVSEEQPPSNADRFRKMAERIEHNTDSTFGGAFVICVPGGIVEPMESLILDSKGDAVQFLNLLQFKIQSLLEDIKEQERKRTGFR